LCPISSTSFDSQKDSPTLYTSDIYSAGLKDDKSPLAEYTVNVTNTGNVVSDVSVLGFLTTSNLTALPGVSPPLSTLFGFDKVHNLAPGATATVYFFVGMRQLLHVDEKGDKWIIPGDYTVYWGTSRVKELSHTFSIKGQPTLFKEWMGKYHKKQAMME